MADSPIVHWFPGHMAKATRMITEYIKKVDVVIELLDARIPRSSANPVILELVGQKPHIVLLNKVDLADPKATKEWTEFFTQQGITVLAIDSKSGKGNKKLVSTVERLSKPIIDRWVAKGIRSRSIRTIILGIPNVGKSTLINSLIGQKIAIMSDKPQTTRNRIMCVLTTDNEQVIFLDTPGIHKPLHKLGEYMVKAAEGTLKEVDAILFVVDATEDLGGGERYIMERLQATKKPVILIVNKLDLIDRQSVLPIIEKYTKAYDFAGVVPISAKEKMNLDSLLAELNKYLPEGPQYYPADTVTDQPERLIAAEMIREKVLHLTRDEIPHAIAVDIEEMKSRANDKVYIRATIYVERESQKGIVIGKRGALLKEIGALARKDIETMLGSKTYLDLWVKVKKDWRDRSNVLRELGFRD